ncbi:MAG TPA: hypothetical protein VIJ61_07150, partial [Thermoanaerobaculia bacterium]
RARLGRPPPFFGTAFFVFMTLHRDGNRAMRIMMILLMLASLGDDAGRLSGRSSGRPDADLG